MLALISLVLIIGLYIWVQSRRSTKLAIYLTDHYMRIDKPIPVCGTPDVVWIDKKGVLIVGDYKSRTSGQVQESDIIQLSVYRILLEHTQRRTVANKGYVHFKNGRRVRVKLLDEQVIIALYNQYQKIVSGKAKARCTDKHRYCQHCTYAELCYK